MKVILDNILNISYVIVVLLITILLAALVNKFINKFFNRSSKFIKTDPTNFKFLKHFISGTIYIVGIGIACYIIPSLRTISVSLFTGAGIFAAIIGLASQQAFSNIVHGIFIVIFKPFRVGDRLEIKGLTGVVEDITLRHTIVKSPENKMIFIPNSIVGEEIITNANISDEKICRFIDMNVAIESDLDVAMRIMREEAEKHPECLDERTSEDKTKGLPKVAVKLIAFKEDIAVLRAYAWARNPNVSFDMHCDLNKSIKDRFDKAGIEFASRKHVIMREEEEEQRKIE